LSRRGAVVGLRNLFGRAKRTVDDRGGVDSLKEDAEELRDIARGKGSTTDKAKEAAEALKDPGAAGGEPASPPRRATGAKPPRDAR
jgi:hypothetical protein